MNCPKCNSKVSDDDMFCQNCGYALTEEKTSKAVENVPDTKASKASEIIEAAEKEKNNLNESDTVMKKDDPVTESVIPDSNSDDAVTADGASIAQAAFKPYILIAAAAILVIAVIIVCVFCMSGGKNSFTTIAKNAPYTISKDGEVLVFSGSKQIGKADGDSYAKKSSFDGTVLSFIADDELYCVSNSEMKKVASDIESYAMAVSGNALAYLTDDSLYIYNIKAAKNEKINNDVKYFVISPDGSYVAYTDDDDKCHIYCAGKNSDVEGNEIYPIAISNNAKYFYYGKNSNLYVYTNGESIKITNDIGGNYVRLNNDCSEIIFSSNNNVYISKNGGDKQKLASDSLFFSILLPESLDCVYSSDICINYPFDTFDKKIMGGGSLRYITQNKGEWSTEKITSSYNDVILSENGNKLAYIKNEKVYLINNLQKSLDGEEIADDAESIYANGSLSDIYFISDDNELKYISGADKSNKIADDVHRAVVSSSGDIFFLVEDTSKTSILYYCSDKKSKEKVVGGENTYTLYGGSYLSVFFVEFDDDSYNYYVLDSGNKFTCIVKDADLY